MIDQKTVNIKGTDYLITQLPAMKGVRVFKVLVKFIGPAFATFQKDQDLSGAMTALFDNIDATPVEGLLQELMSTVSKGSVAVNFDSEFAGEYDRLFLLSKEVVEFNFGSVFTLLGSDTSIATL